jgi:hypothetical protein
MHFSNFGTAIIEQVGQEQTFYLSDKRAIHLLALATQSNMMIQQSFLALDHKRKTLETQAELLLKNPFLSDDVKKSEYLHIYRQLKELSDVNLPVPENIRPHNLEMQIMDGRENEISDRVTHSSSHEVNDLVKSNGTILQLDEMGQQLYNNTQKLRQVNLPSSHHHQQQHYISTDQAIIHDVHENPVDQTLDDDESISTSSEESNLGVI